METDERIEPADAMRENKKGNDRGRGAARKDGIEAGPETVIEKKVAVEVEEVVIETGKEIGIEVEIEGIRILRGREMGVVTGIIHDEVCILYPQDYTSNTLISHI